jgi:hypothetical protein
MRPVWLVQPVGQSAADQGEVGALDPKYELRGGRDVGDRVGDANLLRDGVARVLGRNLLAGDHHHRLHALRRIESGRGDAAAILGTEDEAAVERGRDVVGMALDLGCLEQDVLGLVASS